MRGKAFLAVALVAAATGVALTVGRVSAATGSCRLANGIEHVVYLQFDNTHYKPDRPNVKGDIQQMPALSNFLTQNGTLFTNDHTILISHTADGILSSLTGLYPDRNGATVGNSFGYFGLNGATGFSSTFKYWTDVVDATNDPKPAMITFGGKNTPAPWVPFTRAGCDVGGVGTANIELENTSTNATGDMTKVFGTGSPEFTEAQSNAALAQTDFVGIAIHCGNAPSSKCANDANARADALPDEPGGYNGFKALFGAKYVDPAIANGQPCVPDTGGRPVEDPDGNCGFPGFDGMEANNTLGYVAAMQEAGVPVTYGYISDAHDCHVPNTTTDAFVSTAQGPGEACFEQQINSYNSAFQSFFSGLASHGITKANTLFVITVDEGDHFAGGTGTPQADGTLAYSHDNCSTLTACPANQIGEVNANLPPLLPAGEPSFAVHSDDAPTVYVAGNPGPNDPGVRKLERDLGALKLPDPYVSNGAPTPATVSLADPAEERALHMVNADPARTPTFTDFGQDDFFFTAGSNPSCGGNPCVSPGFAWNHGDVQQEIANTWVGIVGPGVAHHGVDDTTWTDHTNLRPTIMALTGLEDDYVEDGRILTQALDPAAIPTNLIGTSATQLGALYEQLNAAFGQYATDTLAAATKAIEGSDTAHQSFDTAVTALTKRRDYVAGKIKTALWRAAFSGRKIPPGQAKKWLAAGQKVLGDAKSLPTS